MTKLSLNGQLLDDILFAMENQDSPSVFDLQGPGVVAVAGLSVHPDEHSRYLPLPLWTPQDGFQLMSGFTDGLRNPLLKHNLRCILDSGQGVFRRFKAAVKEQPLAQRQWVVYKRRKLEERVWDWLEEWQEFWELESRAVLEDEPTPPVESEFEIVQNSDYELESLQTFDRLAFAELDPDDQGLALRAWCRRYGTEIRPNDRVLWALGPEGPVGVLWLRMWSFHERTWAETLLWYVEPEFRGMGLGRSLLSKAEQLTGPAAVFELTIAEADRALGAALERAGFGRTHSVYFKNLSRSPS